MSLSSDCLSLITRLFEKLFITNFPPLDSNLVLTALYSMWINILILSTILTSRRGPPPYSVTQGLYGQMRMLYFTPAPAVPEVSPQQNMHLHTIYSLFKVQIIKSGRLNKWCLTPGLSLWEDVWCERDTGTFTASELYVATHTSCPELQRGPYVGLRDHRELQAFGLKGNKALLLFCSYDLWSSIFDGFYFLINRGRKVNWRREQWNNGAEADLKELALDFEDGRSRNPRSVASGLSVAPLRLCLGPVTPFSHFLLPEL